MRSEQDRLRAEAEEQITKYRTLVAELESEKQELQAFLEEEKRSVLTLYKLILVAAQKQAVNNRRTPTKLRALFGELENGAHLKKFSTNENLE